jgi:hypothetical protein
MYRIKGLVIGAVLAIALIQVSSMARDIGAGIRLYKSLTPQEIAEVKAIINGLRG